MKKLCLGVILTIVSLQNMYAQGISFGITGGLLAGTADVSVSGFDIGDLTDDLDVLDGGGFYLGFLADIETIEKLHIQPELLYANVGGESSVFMPIMVKYYVAKSFNLQAGPQFDFLIDLPATADELVNSFGFSLAVGAGFDINEKIVIQGKYTVGVNNRANDRISDLLDLGGFVNLNPSLKINTLQIGVVYKL